MHGFKGHLVQKNSSQRVTGENMKHGVKEMKHVSQSTRL